MLGKEADNIYKTRRGYHIIWTDLPITTEQMFDIRKKLGDDKNRLKLDMHGHRITQVLFSEKEYRLYDVPENEGERKLKKREFSKRERIK